MNIYDLIILAQTTDIPTTWVGVASVVVTSFTTIITGLLVRIDNRLAAFDRRMFSLEQALSDLAQSNLFRVIGGDANGNTKQEASAMLASMQRRRRDE